MVTVTNIATRILDENGWQLSDLPQNSSGSTYTLTQLEYLIDNAIEYINIRLLPSEDGPINSLSGTAGSKSLTGTRAEVFCVKQAVSIITRTMKEMGQNISLDSLSLSQSQSSSDPHYANTARMLKECINDLKKNYQEIEASLA